MHMVLTSTFCTLITSVHGLVVSRVLCRKAFHPDPGYATNKAVRVSSGAWRRGYTAFDYSVCGIAAIGPRMWSSRFGLGYQQLPGLRSDDLDCLIVATCVLDVAYNTSITHDNKWDYAER
jgi:hypothetical protein